MAEVRRSDFGATGCPSSWSREAWDEWLGPEQEITAHGKALGQIGHRILLGEKELVVIDEWPNEESCQTFFSGAPRMQEFLSGLGCL